LKPKTIKSWLLDSEKDSKAEKAPHEIEEWERQIFEKRAIK